MGHIHAFALAAPSASAIIHLGATSFYVTDNSELILMRDAMRKMLIPKLSKLIQVMADFAMEHRAAPTLGYTHYQQTQPTTSGKRACMWLQARMHGHA
jgi:adenylosuccinate lyase